MKLIRFSQGEAKPRFGVVIGDRAVAFSYVAPGHRARTCSRLRQHAAAGGGLLHLQRHLGPRRAGAGVRRRLLPDEGHGQGQSAGAYLVTADEVSNPYALKVVVKVDGQVRYQGSTSEIDHRAEVVFAWLGFISSIQPGTVVGMGTHPDCTGLDHDDFIDPGAEIEIGIERLGTLRCRFAEPVRQRLPSRWPLRTALRKFHGP